MPESIKMTTFTNLKVINQSTEASYVLANGRFGGHIVAGHVDGTGRIINQMNKPIMPLSLLSAPKICYGLCYL